jgi:hypothetical protein
MDQPHLIISIEAWIVTVPLVCLLIATYIKGEQLDILQASHDTR